MRLDVWPALIVLAAPGCVAGGASPRSDAPAPSPSDVQVMIVGSYHMAGSTTDLINHKVDSRVLSEQGQRELRAIIEGLASFKPTVIFTERAATAPDYVDPKFNDFTDAMLAENPNELVQIAYRLARRTGVTRVHGIDERATDGEPDYFPFERLAAHAVETGQKAVLDSIRSSSKKRAETFDAAFKNASIADKLIRLQEDAMSQYPSFYYRLAELDVGETQPGAELQAYWFMRNAKTWSKLRDLVRPGDRAVIVFGAGHKFWLSHMAQHSPGFVLVDPVPFLGG